MDQDGPTESNPPLTVKASAPEFSPAPYFFVLVRLRQIPGKELQCATPGILGCVTIVVIAAWVGERMSDIGINMNLMIDA